jgi:predicted small secreted protein
MESINDYNKYLVDNYSKINILEYVKEVNKRMYNIDISFIDEFLDLVEKDDFCIPHTMLIKYGVITTNDSNHIQRILDQYEFIQNKDYLLLPTLGSRYQVEQNIKINILLNPIYLNYV